MIAPKTAFAFAGTLLASALLASSPAAAQDAAQNGGQNEGGERINMVIAYSEDECPEAQDNEIVVCEILVEAERYRIPSNLRTSDNPANVSRSRQVEKFRYAGAFGIMSCDPAGAGGSVGCTQRMIDAAYQDKEKSSRVRFAQLIEQARQERLSTIDMEAAEEQERVEQIEREYLNRLEQERDAPLPGETAQSPVVVATDTPPTADTLVDRAPPPPGEAPAQPSVNPAVGPTLEPVEEGGSGS
ncbi:MAG: hypothetical protein AAF553_04600 [Pseudomonadota bacterium]